MNCNCSTRRPYRSVNGGASGFIEIILIFHYRQTVKNILVKAAAIRFICKRGVFLKSVILTVVTLISAHIWSASKNDIIVFGFDSALLNDVQERIFREELMKDLIEIGITPVPVMDIEFLVQEQQLKIRTVPVKQVKEITLDHDAVFAVKGSIESSDGGYTVTLVIYDTKKDRIFEKKITAKSSQSFASVYKDTAKLCAETLIKIIR
jgi:hypothetical protein